MHIVSLGAGVQSTTMALMAAHGEIEPMPDAAIFADTQWEPRAVYRHLDWLTSPNVLPFPVHVVTAGSLRDKVMQEGYSDVPWHTSQGLGRRQCTKVFKLYPLRDKAKELCGVSHGRELSPSSIVMWIGISTDEAARMKPSTVKYIENRWPLIEQRMSRGDCKEWMRRNEYLEPPRSACNVCPYKRDQEWRATKNDLESWTDAVETDRAIRTLGSGNLEQYAHRSLKPLDEVDFSTAEDRGQLNMFDNECEGMCGV